jgi:hypothetical protein
MAHPNSQSLRIVVLGYVVRGPLGGMIWSNLQFLMGLASLGHDVWFVEDSDDYPSCYDPTRQVTDTDPTYGLDFAHAMFRHIGFAERWSYYDAHGSRWHGPAAGRIASILASADLMVNLCGMNPVRPWLRHIPVRALVDEDPAFTQIRHLVDDAARQRALDHNAFFTFAVNLGTQSCSVPDDGLPWRATRQPLVLDWIRRSPGLPLAAFTTVMQWESYPSREYAGRHFGTKSVSFQEYLRLPRRVRAALEVALGGAAAPREQLREFGWRVIDSVTPTRDLSTYQDYIACSKAEFSVAKHGYAITRSGWFSERSVAYLASGRPVVIQETGFSDWLPTGIGIVPFSSADEAVVAIDDVDSRYDLHCNAARALVEEYFDARKVLPRLIEDCFAACEDAGRLRAVGSEVAPVRNTLTGCST